MSSLNTSRPHAVVIAYLGIGIIPIQRHQGAEHKGMRLLLNYFIFYFPWVKVRSETAFKHNRSATESGLSLSLSLTHSLTQTGKEGE